MYKLCCKANSDAAICDNDGICESGENKNNCDDCDSGFCGDGSKNGNEQCDPPGGQAQCQSGYTCNGQCLCEPQGGGNGGGGGGSCTDNDGDGYGAGNDRSGCANQEQDCNDDNRTINPGATEVCDNVDNDCDGLTNEGGVCSGGDPDFDCDDLEYGFFTKNYRPADGEPHQLVDFCKDYTKVDDENGDYGKTDTDFKINSCIQNCNRIPLSEGGYCGWDVDECIEYEDQGGGLTCRIEYSNVGVCGEDDTSRNITIRAINVNPNDNRQCTPPCDNPDGNGWCTKEVPCPRVIQLPFFTGFNFIITLVIICGIYLYLINKK